MINIKDITNTIIQGDCLEVMKRMPDNCVDLVLTDPPYGIKADKTQNTNAKSGRVSNGGVWKEYSETDWDSEIPTNDMFQEIFRVSRNAIIWGGNYFFLPSCCKWLVWNKIQRSVMTDGEMAWTTLQGQVEIFDMARTDAYINTPHKKVHPTQKPVPLMQWCFEVAKFKGLVLDPFCGSGSTCVSAELMGHDYIGIEISEEYCEIAKQRIIKETRQLKFRGF